MKNTGVEAQYLRPGDRVQWLRRGEPAGYRTVRFTQPDEVPNRVVVFYEDKHGQPHSWATYRKSEYVVVEWRPGIHERDLEEAAS